MSAMAAGLDRDQLRLYGSRPGSAGKRPITYATGRVCEARDCRTVLSRYNRSDLCWQHEPRHEFLSAVRGRRPAEIRVIDELLQARAS